MKKSLSISVLILVGVLFSNTTFAKKKKIKFGNISIEELAMKVYSLDTSAPAVVLYESGYYDGKNHQFYHHKRIKILKKEGYYMANNKFNTSAKGRIKGVTINLENGKIVVSKLEKESVYEEKLWDYRFIYNVALPDVKVGSVIDIEVRYDGFPINWYFQKHIPVVFSELELGDNQYLTFRKTLTGFIRPKLVDYQHWVAENMPAFINEPYLSSSRNYLTKIELDVLETHFPGYYPLDYAYSWKTINTLMHKYKRFGKIIDLGGASFLNKYASKIKEKATNETEMAQMAVETIKLIMEWNGSSRLFLSEANLSEVLYNKSGNSADINIMLIKLLQKLDIDLIPMVMSTRANGMLDPVKPSLNKLNYVMPYVQVDGTKFMLLDATDKNLPYNMLPPRCLNYFGRLLDDREVKKLSLIPDKKFSKRSFYDLELDENLILTGVISHSNKDYAAYRFRNNYDEFLGDKDYVENLMEKNNGLIITDYSIENIKDLEKPVVEKYETEIEDAIIVIDNQAYINMFLLEQIKENPFKIKDRKYPVDFTYQQTFSGVIRIKLPSNFSIAELPEPANMSLPENSVKFTMMYQFTNNVLTLNYKLMINRVVFPESVYANIREFYTHIVSNQSKPVIININ